MWAAHNWPPYHLDSVGTVLWQSCDGTATVEEIADDLAHAGGLAPEVAHGHVEAFVDWLNQWEYVTYEPTAVPEAESTGSPEQSLQPAGQDPASVDPVSL